MHFDISILPCASKMKTTMCSSFTLISIHLLLFTFTFISITPNSMARPIDDQTHTSHENRRYCESWRYAVETNNPGKWSTVPKKCVKFVKKYVEGERFKSDSEIVADFAITFAKSVNMSGNGKDSWVFDIDETVLSNLPYYQENGYGSEPYDEVKFDSWVNKGAAKEVPASRRLFNELKKLKFTIFLLTGRDESERNVTEKNLYNAGYSGWQKVILRGESDHGKKAEVYKSEKRKEIESAGYIIHGNIGDQWSDLTGFSVATRSFKLPNPLYYIA